MVEGGLAISVCQISPSKNQNISFQRIEHSHLSQFLTCTCWVFNICLQQGRQLSGSWEWESGLVINMLAEIQPLSDCLVWVLTPQLAIQLPSILLEVESDGSRTLVPTNYVGNLGWAGSCRFWLVQTWLLWTLGSKSEDMSCCSLSMLLKDKQMTECFIK